MKSRAALEAAEAQVMQMQATVAEARANLARLRQVAELSGGKVPSKTELDTGEAALKRAEAKEAARRAAVGQAEATLKSDETTCPRRSSARPIDGVVLARKIEPGQTVAASLSGPGAVHPRREPGPDGAAGRRGRGGRRAGPRGPVRHLRRGCLAQDGNIRRASPASRYGSQTKENVVSYQAILMVNNADLILRPGMTATAEITTAKRENVLLVPNAALRFTPPAVRQGGEKERQRSCCQPVPAAAPPAPRRERVNGQRRRAAACMS